MKQTHFPAAVAVAFLMAVQGLSAQDLSVPYGLESNETVVIEYKNPNMGGKKIQVAVDNGDPGDPQTQMIEIQLDSNGEGSANWTVPAWRIAKFNAPDVAEEFRYID